MPALQKKMRDSFLDDTVRKRLKDMEERIPSESRQRNQNLSKRDLLERAKNRIPQIGYQYMGIDEYISSMHDLYKAFSDSGSEILEGYRQLVLRTAVVAEHVKRKHNADFVYEMHESLRVGAVDDMVMHGWILNNYFVPKTEEFRAVEEGYPEYEGLLAWKQANGPYFTLFL